MFIVKRFFFLFILLIIFSGHNIAMAQDFQSILAGADFGDMIVTSGNGTLSFEYVRVDSLSIKAQEDDQVFLSRLSMGEEAVINNQDHIDMLFAFEGPKIRIDEKSLNLLPSGRLYKQNWQWAYNGEKTDLLRYDGLGNKGLILPKGSIRTNNDIPVNRLDPRYNGMKILGSPVGSFLRGTFGDKTVENIRIIGEEMQDNISCTVIRGEIDATGETITIWLAPEILFRPKHVELISTDSKTVIHNTFNEYNSIWFPDTIVKSEYYYENGNEILYVYEAITVADGFILNENLDTNLFEIDFPAGLMVHDYRIGQDFEAE